ncbi:MAG: hypothetical protein F3745_09980 [Nitrospinae bacterium]|nr:hypothetical protein [Nitrospinota bacterium]
MATKPAKSDLKNLSIREIAIIAVTLVTAIGYGFYEFEYKVQIKKIEALKKQSSEIKATTGAFQQALITPERTQKTKAEIKHLKDEIIELQSSIDKIKARLTGQDLEILDELQNDADFY